MKRVFYGDLHGRNDLLPRFRKQNPDADEIIIVGDMGVGFPGPYDQHLLNYGQMVTAKPRVRFIRGNHDDPAACKKFVDGGVTWIPDGTVEDGILFVGGAWSIDQSSRTPGVTWWEDEELTYAQWENIYNSLEGLYETIHTVISHDAPGGVLHRIMGAHKPIHPTVTSNELEFLRARLPNVKLWLFGHYHVNLEFWDKDTFFRCLADDGATKFVIERD